MAKRYDKELTLEEIAAIPDEAIDYSDIPELTDEFFRNAKLLEPQGKKQLTVRLDEDVLAWFRAQGPGYQSRMNAVLRAYVQSQANDSKR